MSKPGKWVSAVLAAIVLLALVAWITIHAISLTPMKVKAAADRKIRADTTLTGGAEIYVAKCAYCHENGVAPPLPGKNLPAASVVAFVRHGYDVMPAFTPGTISDAGLAQLSAYVAKLSKTPVAEIMP